MPKLKCDECGNTSGWRNVVFSSNKTKATCGDCGTKVIREGAGYEFGTVSGNMTFDWPNK